MASRIVSSAGSASVTALMARLSVRKEPSAGADRLPIDRLPDVRASEPRQIGKRQPSPAHVHASVLRAACERGDRLARVEDAGRVEGALDREEGLELLGRELRAHRFDLLDAHAVFAGDGAAELDAQLEDLGAEALGALPLVG